jgi:hypothetical protein
MSKEKMEIAEGWRIVIDCLERNSFYSITWSNSSMVLERISDGVIVVKDYYNGNIISNKMDLVVKDNSK